MVSLKFFIKKFKNSSPLAINIHWNVSKIMWKEEEKMHYGPFPLFVKMKITILSATQH